MANSTQILAALLPRFISLSAGLWLMAMPAIFNYAGSAAATSDRIAGPFVVCFATVAIWEATRNVRLANLPLAIWVMISPFVLSGHPPAATALCVASGLVIGAMSLIRGPVQHRFGGGWTVLWIKTPPENHLENP